MSLNKKEKKEGWVSKQAKHLSTTLPPLLVGKVQLDRSLCHLGHSLARPRVFVLLSPFGNSISVPLLCVRSVCHHQ